MSFEPKLKPATRKRVIDLYRAGAKVPDITEETGVSRSTVYWLLKEQGVQTRKKPGPRTGLGASDSLVSPPDVGSTIEPLLAVIAEQQEKLLEQERRIGQLQEQLKQARAK